ncbi:hypothetical protein LguiA_028020 [Lonicera macranthoides]
MDSCPRHPFIFFIVSISRVLKFLSFRLYFCYFLLSHPSTYFLAIFFPFVLYFYDRAYIHLVFDVVFWEKRIVHLNCKNSLLGPAFVLIYMVGEKIIHLNCIRSDFQQSSLCGQRHLCLIWYHLKCYHSLEERRKQEIRSMMNIEAKLRVS